MKAIKERHVQAIWYDAALRPSCLLTRNGSAVRVLSPGVWNLGEGPDFRDAVLEVGPDARRVVGDVEIHLCPNDWDLHKHGTDPNYRNVVAHVTWGCGPIPRTLPSRAVSIWIGRFVMDRPDFSIDAIDLSAYPYCRLPLGMRPCQERFLKNSDECRRLIVKAGQSRLRQKAMRINGRLCEASAHRVSREQIFYEEVMTAMGYSRNKVTFRRVAERVPLEELLSAREFAGSALLTAGSFEALERGGCRPRNAPLARLAKAAESFVKTPIRHFSDAADFSRKGCRKLTDGLCGTNLGLRVMGSGRAAAILANVIVPFALAEGRLDSVPEWLPAEDVSAPVRLMANRLFGRDHNPAVWYRDNGVAVQGLLALEKQCRGIYPFCTDCGFGDKTGGKDIPDPLAFFG